MRGRSRHHRVGTAVVAMIIVLVLLNLMIAGLVIGGSRDHDLSIRRLETIRAFYAAESGMNMAIREIMQGADEDGDGATGTISDDGNDANDPTLSFAQFVVTSAIGGGQTILTSEGRSGESRRTIEAVLE